MMIWRLAEIRNRITGLEVGDPKRERLLRLLDRLERRFKEGRNGYKKVRGRKIS